MKFHFLIVLSLIFFAYGCFRPNTEDEKLPGCGVKSDPSSPSNAPLIFKSKCATCHDMNRDGTGPKLKNVMQRIPNEAWLDDFLRNEDSLVRIGDTHAIAIQSLKPVDGNHQFRTLKDEDLRILKEYLSQ